MSLNTVTLTWDFVDLIQSGESATLVIVPTAQLTDATDGEIVAEVPRSVIFSGGMGQLAGIIANDNANVSPSGTGYTVTVTTVAGLVIYSQTVIIAYAAGATQKLSSLTPAQNVTAMASYLTGSYPGGAPGAAEWLSGDGTWTAPTAAQVGADTSGAAAAETTRAEAAEAGKVTGITPAASKNVKPANPAGTTSTTLVMMGVGSVISYTPAGSGIVRVDMTCQVQTMTATQPIQVSPQYGTGTAPANGAALSGTTWGISGNAFARPSAFNSTQAYAPYAATDRLVLTPGITYWFDLALATANSADAAFTNNVSVTIEELTG